MSLNWNIEKVENNKEICWIDQPDGKTTMNPVTEALIFACIPVGIGRITDDNWKEFAARLKTIQALSGAFLISQDGPKDIEPEDVKQHIGLSVNVADETRAKFKTRLNQYVDDIKRGISD